MLASDPADRLHNQHPPPPTSNRGRQPTNHTFRGSILDADPPTQGVRIARRITKRTVYGPRSEKLVADTAQLPLELDDLIFSEATAAANDDAAGPRPARPCSPRLKAARNIGALPKHLPRY